MGYQGVLRRRFVIAALVVLGLFAGACGGGDASSQSTAEAAPPTTAPAEQTTVPAPPSTDSAAPSSTEVAEVAEPVCTEPLPGELVLDDTSELDDPDTGSESWPDEGAYNRWSWRDGPESAYRPCFVPAANADFEDETVVVGVASGGEARAYAIEQLVAHYVNDRFGDDPLLVSY